MTDVFFTATKNALKSITTTFDTVWPTAVGLWNLRCLVNGVRHEYPDITESELANKFSVGSGIHGVNYKRAFSDNSWEQQQMDFAWILLNSTFPIYEEWLLELKTTIFKNMDVKAMQSPTAIANEVSRLTNNQSSILTNAFYSTYCGKRERNYQHITELMMCYKAFKEARNCFMHHGVTADCKLINAYNAFINSASEAILGVKEIPILNAPTLDERINLSLRGVVGFSYVLIKILVSLDTELLRSKEAEIELVDRFKKSHTTMPKLKSDQNKANQQVEHLIMQCSFPKPQSVNDIKNFLLTEHLISK